MNELDSITVDKFNKQGFNLRQIFEHAVQAMLDSNNNADRFEIRVFGLEITISRRKTIDFSNIE